MTQAKLEQLHAMRDRIEQMNTTLLEIEKELNGEYPTPRIQNARYDLANAHSQIESAIRGNMGSTIRPDAPTGEDLPSIGMKIKQFAVDRIKQI